MLLERMKLCSELWAEGVKVILLLKNKVNIATKATVLVVTCLWSGSYPRTVSRLIKWRLARIRSSSNDMQEVV